MLRLLRTLGEEHFVFRDRTHRYHLGARIHELSSRRLDQREVRAERDELIAALTFVPRTPNTITDADAVRAELDRVRFMGWADDGEENEPSVNRIAAPVRDASGRAVAAVSVSVPNIVLSDERLLELLPSLLAVTERISREHGWRH